MSFGWPDPGAKVRILTGGGAVPRHQVAGELTLMACVLGRQLSGVVFLDDGRGGWACIDGECADKVSVSLDGAAFLVQRAGGFGADTWHRLATVEAVLAWYGGIARWAAPCRRFELDADALALHPAPHCRRCLWDQGMHEGGSGSRAAQQAGFDLRNAHPYVATAEQQPAGDLARTIAVVGHDASDVVYFLRLVLEQRLGADHAQDLVSAAMQTRFVAFTSCTARCSAGGRRRANCQTCGGRAWIATLTGARPVPMPEGR